MNNNNSRPVKNTQTTPPFLKWAGGKRWLVDKHSSMFNIKFDRYIEPFLGSGAVFFKFTPSKAILADSNAQLINTYSAIRDNWETVVSLLNIHQELHSKDYYYLIRGQRLESLEEKAAQFIYLNRACWNGLYRVNMKGEFNVPIGTKTNIILDADDFERVSQLLQGVEILNIGFETTLAFAQKGDFVFIDPPYTVKHNNNGFVKYNESLFTWDDQIKLKDSIVDAVSRGAKVIVTNANHESIRDLYQGVGEQLVLDRASVIAGNAKSRGRYEEMVIKCL